MKRSNEVSKASPLMAVSKAPPMVQHGLNNVPISQRERMISGMRWTLWLSITCAPLGYITTILLARVGPEVIGTYGLLTLYIALTSVFLFFGGNGVAIKFLPEIQKEQRFPFLLSYLLIVLAATLPYQLVATFWPASLRTVLGTEVHGLLAILLIWLAPIYIVFSLVLAALKGLLEIKWAQIYNRVITILNFAIYLGLFLFARKLLATHYSEIIWLVYLVLSVLVLFLSTQRLFRQLGKTAIHFHRTFFLPKGFWRYTGGLQANSMLSFFSSRLDYIFMVNVAGLAVFGKYVALLTLVSVVPQFATFVLDSLLPSLTNTLATRDYDSSRRLTEIYLRFMLPCGMVAATFATLFARPVLELLGPKYSDMTTLALIAFPIAGIQVLNWFAGTLLNAIGEPHLNAIARAVRCIVFAIVFWPLWDHYKLLGAILAWTAGTVVDQISLMILMYGKMPYRFSLGRTYMPFLGTICIAGIATAFIENVTPVVPFGIWLILCTCFFVLAGYTVSEIRELAYMVLPTRVSTFFSLTPGAS